MNKLLTNKHIIVALIVAPILAIIAYVAVDYIVKEKPKAAVKGSSYPLIAKSNCRWTSGECDLVNEEFRAKLTVQKQETGEGALFLDANFPLESVQVGIAPEGQSLDQTKPLVMQIADEAGQQWQLSLPFAPTEKTLIAIAMTANGSHYFAETNMAFSEYKTLFDEDFRRQ